MGQTVINVVVIRRLDCRQCRGSRRVGDTLSLEERRQIDLGFHLRLAYDELSSTAKQAYRKR